MQQNCHSDSPSAELKILVNLRNLLTLDMLKYAYSHTCQIYSLHISNHHLIMKLNQWGAALITLNVYAHHISESAN